LFGNGGIGEWKVENNENCGCTCFTPPAKYTGKLDQEFYLVLKILVLTG